MSLLHFLLVFSLVYEKALAFKGKSSKERFGILDVTWGIMFSQLLVRVNVWLADRLLSWP